MEMQWGSETMAHAWARARCGHRRENVPLADLEGSDADMIGTMGPDQRWQFPDGSAVIYDPELRFWDYGIHSSHFDILAQDNLSVWYRIEEGEMNEDEYPATY